MARAEFELIWGPMFSGKTEELIRRLTAASAAGARVVAAKPSIERDPDQLISLTGARWPAVAIASAGSLLDFGDGFDVVGIDEVQFLGDEIAGVIAALREQGVRVIAAGLDLDFRGEAFGAMPALRDLADSRTALTAVCQSCGGVATMTQRLVGGVPAMRDAPVVQVGGPELYEPRCSGCHIVAPVVPKTFEYER